MCEIQILLALEYLRRKVSWRSTQICNDKQHFGYLTAVQCETILEPPELPQIQKFIQPIHWHFVTYLLQKSHTGNEEKRKN